ncbi:hypothetical protein VF13_38720, partial [Nostoc linckia z16]
MKGIKLLLLLLLCSTAFAQLQTETFEGVFPPTGWGIYDNSIGTTFSWQRSNATAAQPAHEGQYAAYIERENVPTGTAHDWLITPQFQLPQNAEVRFWSRLTQGGNQGGIYKLLLSTGSSQGNLSGYSLVKQWTENEINPTQLEYNLVTVPIPADIAAAGTPVYIAFVMEADQMDRWLIDDVAVQTACSSLTGLSVNPGATTAEITWSQPGTTSWEIEIIGGYDTPTGVGVVVNGNPAYTATGLSPGAPYKYFVRSLCGGVGTWQVGQPFNTKYYGYNCTYPIDVSALPYFSVSDVMSGSNDYSASPGSAGCGSLPVNYTIPAYNIYHYVATATGDVEIEVNPERNETAIFVYGDCSSIGASCIAGTAAPVPLQKKLTFPAINGEDYYIMVASQGGNNYSIAIKEPCAAATFSSTFDIVSDCEASSGFTAVANISATALSQVIVKAYDNLGNEAAAAQTVSLPVTAPLNFGPFGPTDIITLVIQDDSNANCSITSKPLSKRLCPAANDNCSEAINIEPAIPNQAEAQFGTLNGATASLAAYEGCPGSEDDDVWYTFTAQNQRHLINIFNINGVQLDLDHALYEGPCSQMNLIYCSDENTSIAENLVIGQTYYIRVFTSGNTSSNTTFQINTIAFEPNCTDTNSQSAVVLDLFKKLLNHLLSQQTVPDGYNCPELIALAPYITDPNPRIYNFTSQYYLSFTFSQHPQGEYDVFFGPVNPLISRIDVINYSTPDDFT